MGDKVVALRGAFIKVEESNLEDIIDFISKYGKIHMFKMNDGTWHTDVDMYVTGSGVAFKVASEFTHTTLLDSVRCCGLRLTRTIESLANNK